MFDFEAVISREARRLANEGVKSFGPLGRGSKEVLLMAGPDIFDTRPRAIELWFSSRFRNGMCPASSDGLTLKSQAFNDPYPTREFSAFLLGYPGGVGRTSIYHGDPDTVYKTFETLADAFVYAGAYVVGLEDDVTSRFLWSEAWYRIECFGEPGDWTVAIWYLRPAPGELGS